MKKLRDRARTPLIVALPAILSLVLIASMPTWTFGREAPPILREETDGGGDEWSNELVPPQVPTVTRSSSALVTQSEDPDNGSPYPSLPAWSMAGLGAVADVCSSPTIWSFLWIRNLPFMSRFGT
jgi:hypothetical protein